MKVLISGASGQVGQALVRRAPPDAEVRALTRSELDITDPRDVRAAVAVFQPDLIINAAAYTAVDKAEAEPGLADAINARGPRLLAQAALAIHGCRLLHVPTDYVFDGRSGLPYKPDDATNPLSVYGRTKLAGESAVLEVLGERAVVLRTAWLYAAQGKNFVLTMLRLMRELQEVRVVADQRGAPTAADSIARALWAVAEQRDIHGVLHWTDQGDAEWYSFALAIAEEGRTLGLLSKPVRVTPITTAEYPTPAHRPANSLLDCRDSILKVGFRPAHWRVNLRRTLEKMARASA
jgi:dTDP-4-dehydrorhamnose reductase